MRDFGMLTDIFTQLVDLLFKTCRYFILDLQLEKQCRGAVKSKNMEINDKQTYYTSI